MSVLLHSAAWLFGAVVGAGLALRPAFGDELSVTRYTGYVMPWLLVGLLPLAVWAWRGRHWPLATVLSGSAVVVIAMYAPLFVRPQNAAIPGSPAGTLKVMSYNTWSKNGDERRIARVILDYAPDILMLQEIPPDVFRRLMHALEDLYGGSTVHSAYEASIQQAVLSRHPVESRGSSDEKGQAQKVVVRAPSGPIAVFNVHPLRSGGWRQRYRQLASLLVDDVLPERSQVILGGDLNVTEHSQLYKLLSGHLRNAHRAAGYGFGFTFPASGGRLLGGLALPLARIDHVFVSGHFVALRAGTLEEDGGSDHRPVFAELALRSLGKGPPTNRVPMPQPSGFLTTDLSRHFKPCR